MKQQRAAVIKKEEEIARREKAMEDREALRMVQATNNNSNTHTHLISFTPPSCLEHQAKKEMDLRLEREATARKALEEEKAAQEAALAEARKAEVGRHT